MHPEPTATPPAPKAPAHSPDDLLTDVQAAKYLNVAVQTLRNHRWHGTGAKYHRIGARLIRYRRSDLDAYIARGASEQADAA